MPESVSVLDSHDAALDDLARLAALCADAPTGHLRLTPDHSGPLESAPFDLRVPVVDSVGQLLGELRVAGPVPKTLTPAQHDMLAGLARQAAALAAKEKSHRMLVEQLAEGVILADFETGRVSQANCAARKMLGVAYSQVEGLTLSRVFAPGETPTGPELVTAVRAGRAEAGRRRLCHADGSLIDVEMSVGFVPSAGKTMISIVVRDIAERKAYEKRLLEYQAELVEKNDRLLAMATTDGLTQIRNRAAFNDRFADEIRRSSRSSRPLALILFDVDYFKKYNDAFGHPAGDEVLRRVARIFRDSVRATDTAARYGGEEFVAILPETTLEGAEVVADRVRAAIEGYDWPLRPVTISVGVAATPPTGRNAEALLHDADAALYESKRAGRNRVTLAAPRVEEGASA